MSTGSRTADLSDFSRVSSAAPLWVRRWARMDHAPSCAREAATEGVDVPEGLDGYRCPVLRTPRSSSRLHRPDPTADGLDTACKRGRDREANYIADELAHIRTWRDPCKECFPHGLPDGGDQ